MADTLDELRETPQQELPTLLTNPNYFISQLESMGEEDLANDLRDLFKTEK